MSTDDIAPQNILISSNFKGYMRNLPVRKQFSSVTGDSLVPIFQYILCTTWYDQNGNFQKTGPEYVASRNYFDVIYPRAKNFLIVVDGYVAVISPSLDFDSDKKYLLNILGNEVRLTPIDS